MRLGVLADVHANEQALEAVLAALTAARVDGYVCAGDLVGYGAAPDACVRRVLALPGLITVAGNHELMVTGALSDERCTPSAQASLRWTREVLAPDVRAAIEALPRRAVGPGGVVVAHGALDDPQQYVRTAADARTQLAALDEAAVLILGHTHEALAVSDRRGPLRATGTVAWAPGERLLLNPGSVGQARGGAARARALVLDLEARSATFLALRYDLRGCRRTLRAAGLPRDACHVPDPWPARVRRLTSWRARSSGPGVRSNQIRTQRQ